MQQKSSSLGMFSKSKKTNPKKTSFFWWCLFTLFFFIDHGPSLGPVWAQNLVPDDSWAQHWAQHWAQEPSVGPKAEVVYMFQNHPQIFDSNLFF